MAHRGRRDAERPVIEVEDIRVEAEGLQECVVHKRNCDILGTKGVSYIRSG